MNKQTIFISCLLVSINSLLFTGCISNNENNNKQQQSKVRVEDGKIIGDTDDVKKEIDKNFDKTIKKNPFDEQAVNLREVKVNPSKYLGQTIVIGPITTGYNDLKNKNIEIMQIRKTDVQVIGSLFDVDSDSSTQLYYDKEYNSNKKLSDIDSDADAFGYIKGTIKYDYFDNMVIQLETAHFLGSGRNITKRYKDNMLENIGK